MKKTIFILSFLSIISLGCKKNIEKAYTDLEGGKTIALSSIEETLQDTLYFKKPQIIVLETLDESLLSNIHRIAFDDDVLFIFDRSQMKIFSFDVTGKYINKIDYIGQGPGEYVQISDFAIDTDKKQIILLCDIPNKLMYFTYNGVFIKEERLDVYYMRLVIDNSHICFEKMNNIETKGAQLVFFNTETNEIQEGLDLINIKNYLFVSGNSLSKGKDILYVRRFDNSIYEIKNSKIMKKYNVDFKKHSFPDKLIEEESTDKILKECHENEYIYSMSNAIDNEYYTMFKTNLGLFVYNKNTDVLNGYKEIFDNKLDHHFFTYMPLENTGKIVCSIDDPSPIKHAVERMPDEIKKNEKYSEIVDIAHKLIDDNNPILFIYEFKD